MSRPPAEEPGRHGASPVQGGEGAPYSRSPFAANDVIILAGGIGKRLGGVLGDLPKPMLPVMGRPFLEWAVLRLTSVGFRSIVLSIGYRRAVIRDFFGTGARWGAEIRYVEEEEPLGTGGALGAASAETRSDDVLVLNGDTLCLCDPGGFFEFHRACGAEATLCCVRAADASRYGTVLFDGRHRVRSFSEKGASGSGWINAGTCWMRSGFLRAMAGRGPLSLERDVLPRAAGGRLCAYCSDADFIDIGTPEDLARAEEFVRRNRLDRLGRGGRGDE